MAKHTIIKRYVQAWLPIMSRTRTPYLFYFDGFAGAGAYGGQEGEEGEGGSPLVFLETVLGHRDFASFKHVYVLCNELDKERATQLLRRLSTAAKAAADKVTVRVWSMSFDKAVEKLTTGKLKECLSTAGVLAFVDPFKAKTAPMESVRALFNCSRWAEIIVNVMSSSINRSASAQKKSGRRYVSLQLALGPNESDYVPKGVNAIADYYVKIVSEGL